MLGFGRWLPTSDAEVGLFCQFWYKSKDDKDLGLATVAARNFTYIVRNPLERKFNGELRDLVRMRQSLVKITVKSEKSMNKNTN